MSIAASASDALRDPALAPRPAPRPGATDRCRRPSPCRPCRRPCRRPAAATKLTSSPALTRPMLSAVTPAAICTLRALDRGEHDDRGLQLVLELVEGVAQRLGVGAVEPRRQHLEALDVDRLRGEVVALRRRQPALQRGQLLLERAHLLEHLADAAPALRPAPSAARRRGAAPCPRATAGRRARCRR